MRTSKVVAFIAFALMLCIAAASYTENMSLKPSSSAPPAPPKGGSGEEAEVPSSGAPSSDAPSSSAPSAAKPPAKPSASKQAGAPAETSSKPAAKASGAPKSSPPSSPSSSTATTATTASGSKPPGAPKGATAPGAGPASAATTPGSPKPAPKSASAPGSAPPTNAEKGFVPKGVPGDNAPALLEKPGSKKKVKKAPQTKCPAKPVSERNECIKTERDRLDDIYAAKQREATEKFEQFVGGIASTGNEVSEMMFAVKESCMADPAGHPCANSQDKLDKLFVKVFTEVNTAFKKAKVIRRGVEASRKAVINVIKNVKLVKQ